MKTHNFSSHTIEMLTRKQKRGGTRPPLWAGPAAYYVPSARPPTALPPFSRPPLAPLAQPNRPMNPTPNAWKLQQIQVNKTRRNNAKKAPNNNNNYGEVWPVNTSKWTTPVGNASETGNSMTAFNKPALSKAERNKYHKAWETYFKQPTRKNPIPTRF